MEKLPEERQASMGGELLIGGFKFERQNGLWHQGFHLVGEKWVNGWASSILANQQGFLMFEINPSRILGISPLQARHSNAISHKFPRYPKYFT